MKIESSVTAVSWIPSEAIKGVTKLPFEVGIAHYDPPPPEVLDDVDSLIEKDVIREANELRAWIEVDNGKIVGHGYAGRGRIGSTTLKLGPRSISFAGVALPEIRKDPEVTDDSVRFVQTAGGRTGAPAPRRVSGKPFAQVTSPIAWTTLALTLHADGSSEYELVGASPFPRHWIYDSEGKLVQKSGMVDFKTWYREAYEKNTPWGEQDSAAVVSAVESGLERQLSQAIMENYPKLERKTIEAGEILVAKDDPGVDMFLLLDGMFTVEVGKEVVAEVGPGAIVGERALLEGGRRTSNLRAKTKARVVVIPENIVEQDKLLELRTAHRREESPT